MRSQRKAPPLRFRTHLVEGLRNPQRDNRVFDESVGANHEDRLAAPARTDLFERMPNELQRSCRIFPAAITDYPRDVVGKVEFCHLLKKCRDAPLEPRVTEG